jgi:uncharacterized membrane protein
MGLLLTGVLLFFGVHAVPMLAGARAALLARLGEPFYKGLFSILSLAGLVLIVLGFSRTPIVPLWIPPPWFNRPAALAMPLAFILLAAAYIPGNIGRIARHPMLAGVLVWATVHLVANGDLASLLLFGSFAAYALLDIFAVSARVAARSVAKRPLYMDAIAVVAGLVVFRVVWHYHGALFGVPVTY